MIIHSLAITSVPNLVISKQLVHKILNLQHWDDDQQIDLDLWPCGLKSNGKYPLTKGIHCSKFGNFKAKGWKDIEWTTFVYRLEVLTLTFDHVTWKSIGSIYLLGASTLSSLATFKQSGQTTLSGLRLVYRPTRPTNRQVQNRTFQRGIKSTKHVLQPHCA